jgi:hypothetical protein
MEDFTIAIYCFLDDYLQLSHPKEDVKRKMSNAEVLTTAIIAARYFSANFVKARCYMKQVHGCKMTDKSNFNRHLHRLSDELTNIFFSLGQSIKKLNTEAQYIIDSFPVAVCKNIRIKRCKLLKNKAYRGYNHSKREYFYGFKIQIITTANGIPTEFLITAGSYHDATAFEAMNIDLPAGSTLYADSAYTNYELEDYYKELEQIYLLAERKSNSKRPDSPALKFIKKMMRKRIETSFSEILNYFPRKVHAVTPQGFILKLVLFICAYTFNRVI